MTIKSKIHKLMIRNKNGSFARRKHPPTHKELRERQDRINELQRSRRRANLMTEEQKRALRTKGLIYRAKNKEKLAQYRATVAERLRHSSELKKKKQEARKRYQLNYPNKAKAQIKACNAIRLGKVKKQPCAICGENKVHGHHCDYSKPLDLVWLCTKHHQAWHRVFLAENSDG